MKTNPDLEQVLKEGNASLDAILADAERDTNGSPPRYARDQAETAMLELARQEARRERQQLEIVGQLQLLQRPQRAEGAGVAAVPESDHGRSDWGDLRPLCPAGLA